MKWDVGDARGFLAGLLVAGFVWALSGRGDSVVRGAPPDTADMAAGGEGQGPDALAFDGSCRCESYVWVANKFSDSVTKIRTSDGTRARTVEVGRRPVAVLHDKTS